jgi:hypothetical protein
LTINSKDNRVFTTATGFTGFQVSSTEGNAGVLYTENFGGTCGFSTCSHGISLSPDDKEVAVVDVAHKAVQFWDVHGVAESIAPTFVASVPVNGLEGSEGGCAYDCGRDGWVQHSFDGRFVFVGDSGAVIETATRKVVANLTNLLNTRKSIEIDFSEGVPVATTNRTGVGRPGGGAPPPPPVNSTIPTISGTAVEGQTLTEHAGTWTNNPTIFALQWLQCNNLGGACLPISGATKQTYALVAGDVGHTIEVQEMASNAGGSSTWATSAATAVVLPLPPANTAPPTITGTAQQGQTLTEHNGSWTNGPTSYSYQWLQCDSLGNGCLPISGAASQTYVPVEADVGHTIEVQETASNAGGPSAPALSATTAKVLPAPPSNTAPPTITGTAQQGQTLTEHNGSWTNGPTSYSYQWLQCDSLGNGCLPIFGAASQTYVPVEADVGHTIEVQETASNAGGSSSPVTSGATATVVAPPPINTAPPTITGTAQQGQTLTEHNGSWTNEPTGFAYQWQRCDTAGANCSPVSEATAQTYTVGSADVGSTVRVAVTASNLAGASAPASSAQTAVVQQSSATFGKISVGAFPGSYPSNRKQVNRYALPTAGSVTKLSIYLAPSSKSGQQILKGLIYADTGSAPGTLLGVSQQLIFTSASSIGWYELVFFSPLKLAAGKYWIGVISGATALVAGFRYDKVAGSRDYDTNTYAAGPSNPFGSVSTDGRQVSLYATYTAG